MIGMINRISTNRKTDILIIAATATSIILSFFLTTRGTHVFFAFGNLREIPETCFIKSVTGIRCPACGLTRSFINISRLDFLTALSFNAGGIIAYLYVLFQIPYRIIRLVKTERDKVLIFLERFHKYFTIVTAAILLISWIVYIFKLIFP